MSMEWFRLSRF